jgi:phosphatidate phosphatase PAH1
VKQDYSMKLGEGGEAFFVFETSANVPVDLQTSPLVSPIQSPLTKPSTPSQGTGLLDPDPLDLANNHQLVEDQRPQKTNRASLASSISRSKSDYGSQFHLAQKYTYWLIIAR